MKVIPPVDILSIASSTIAEPDASIGETLWVSGATYVVGDKVILTSTHRVYEAVTAHTGRTNSPDVDGVYWLDIGPTNRWAMFDLYRNTSSVFSTGGFSTTINVGEFTDLIILGAHATNVIVTVSSVVGGGILYGPTTTALVSRTVTDYYEYFFTPFIYQGNAIISKLPAYPDTVVTLSSTGEGYISSVVLGIPIAIGYTQRGTTNNALNFSIISRDTYGNSSITVRRSVPKVSHKILIKATDLSKILKLRSDINAIPAVWVGLGNTNEAYFNSMLILGVYKEMTMHINNTELIECTLELEEL